jgi:dTDP-4-dehydrorhamnose reductase
MSVPELNILILGRTGQVARDLQLLLPPVGSVSCVGRPEFDLSQPDSIRELIRQRRPDVLINAAAYTAVDRAESEPDMAMKINAEAPGMMAEEAKRLGSLFISYSTDYVFDGRKSTPYVEGDAPNPLNVYGASKLAGDRAIEAVGGSYIVFRTSWVYSATGRNFLNTIVKLATEREELRVVDDQIGAPTWSRDIAAATTQVIRQSMTSVWAGAGQNASEALRDRRGIYNLTAEGSVSWCGFAMAILEEMKKQRKNHGGLAGITPISTSQYPTPARRPLNSRLLNNKVHEVFGVLLPPWRESLTRVITEKAGQQDNERG